MVNRSHSLVPQVAKEIGSCEINILGMSAVPKTAKLCP